MNDTIIIVGTGGLGREVAEIFRSNSNGSIVKFADDATSSHGAVVDGLSVVGTPEEALFRNKKTYGFAKFVIAIGDNKLRMKMAQRLKELNALFTNAIHGSAIIPKDIRENYWGSGIIIGAGAVITAMGVSVGQFTHIDAGCTISHDCVLGDFVRLNPGVTVCGNCTIGDGTLIGAGATIRNGVTIGKDSMIGMGSVVINNVRDGVSVFGVPAKEITVKS